MKSEQLKIGSCYRYIGRRHVNVYSDPWAGLGSSDDIVISEIHGETIFTVLDEQKVENFGLKQKNVNDWDTNYKVIVDNKIGWITLTENQTKTCFEEIV